MNNFALRIGTVGIEFERKFRVIGDGWRTVVKSASLLRQGYLGPAGHPATVRIRCLPDGAFLAIKGPRAGMARAEFEYGIPLADAEEILRTLCGRRTLEKLRSIVEIDGLIWNIDEFRGTSAGLVLAEVELMSPHQSLPLPEWVGEEVTGRHEFRNAVIAEGGAESLTGIGPPDAFNCSAMLPND